MNTSADRVAITAAFKRLHRAECARDAAIGELIGLGVIRSRVLVGDLGEVIAANYYGVELAPVFTPGYDLVTREGQRVQVKAMRGRSGKRTIVSRQPLPDACDLLLAIRLADDYVPLEAIEVPRQVAIEHFDRRGVHWTRHFAADPRIRRIPGDDLRLTH
jgi:hypothetical protein